ncbi:hypothetical protein GGR54DRAFT_255659 [Hypoxylon sp. NC1633]|nr:hypothetical protein GGR54DRAFT_255659 [Hypoxylon sp. NC1633]
MPVTELAFFTAAGPITIEANEAVNQALSVQDEWCAHNLPATPKGREKRGCCFFQQVEDPSIAVLVAHWDSVEQHQIWLASPENVAVFPKLAEHFQLEKMVFFHIDDVELLKKPEAAGKTSLLESAIISLARITIAAEQRQAADQGWNEVKGILEDFASPSVLKSGWRIEKESEDLEEIVFACGWPSVERHLEFPTTKDFQKYASTLVPFEKVRDIKHYKRVL